MPPPLLPASAESLGLSGVHDKIHDVTRIGPRTPLVGRVEELNGLRHAWARAQEGVAGAVLLAGDAGVGKSRLAGELADHVRTDGGTVLVGHCVGLGQAGPPYLAFFETLDDIRQHSPGMVEQSALFTSLTDSARALGQQPHDQLQFFDAALNLLTSLAETGPVLWVIEDLHWADASMRDLVSFLLARIDRQPVMMVLSYRSDEMHRNHPLRPLLAQFARMNRIQRLDLPAFADAEAREFVRSIIGTGRASEFSEKQIGQIASRSEGNAFFAEELLAAPGPSGSLRGPLADILLSRVEQLTEPAQQVARTLAVAGHRPVTHTTLTMVLAEMDTISLDGALRECVDHHLLVLGPHDSYAFRHALLREAIYGDLLPGERTRLHADHARALAARNQSGLRGAQAFHARQSNDQPAALAAYVVAAEEASGYAAPGDALAHLEDALSLWDAVPEPDEVAGTDQLTLTLRAYAAASATGQHERALAFARSAKEIADADGDETAQAGARRRMARALDVMFQPDEAKDLLDEAWELIRDQPPSAERAWVLAGLALENTSPTRRQYAEMAIAEARSIGEGGAEADASVCLAFHLLSDGDHDGAVQRLREALTLAREVGAHTEAVRVWFNLALTEFEAGQIGAAMDYVTQGLDYADTVGVGWSLYGRELISLAVTIQYTSGAWDEVAARTAPAAGRGGDWVGAVLAAQAALLAADRGEWDAMSEALAAVPAPEEHDVSAGKPGMLATLAQAERHLWQQQPEEAAVRIGAELDQLARADLPFAGLVGVRHAAIGVAAFADLAALARQRADAQEEARAIEGGEAFLARATEGIETGPARAGSIGPESRAWFARAQAEATRLHGVQDIDPWQTAIDSFGYGDLYQQALMRWRLAEVLAAQDAEAAREVLIQALNTAEDLKARPLVEAIHAVARRFRIVLPGGREHNDLLTAREQDVLEHVARGLTNRAVGAELFISEKTVSVHLSRAMAKLSASSRTEAVAQAMQRGILGPH